MSEGYAKEYHLEADCRVVWEAGGYEVTKLSQPKAWLGTPGTPDAYVRREAVPCGEECKGDCGVGDRLFVEYKIGKREPTAVQLQWHEREVAAGGQVIVVRSPDDVVAYLAERGINVSLEG